MIEPKRNVHYRKFIRAAEGIKDGNCKHCVHETRIEQGTLLRCKVIGLERDSRYAIQGGNVCDRWERRR